MPFSFKPASRSSSIWLNFNSQWPWNQCQFDLFCCRAIKPLEQLVFKRLKWLHPVHVRIIGKPKHRSSPFSSLVTAQHEDGSWSQKADGFAVVWMPYSHFKASLQNVLILWYNMQNCVYRDRWILWEPGWVMWLPFCNMECWSTNVLCLKCNIPSNKTNTVAGRSIDNVCPDLFFPVGCPLKLFGKVVSHPMQTEFAPKNQFVFWSWIEGCDSQLPKWSPHDLCLRIFSPLWSPCHTESGLGLCDQ